MKKSGIAIYELFSGIHFVSKRGAEKESFWLFASLLMSTPPNSVTDNPYEPKFEGIKGFYKKGFPLL